MAFVVSGPIPIPMPRFQCQGLQMASVTLGEHIGVSPLTKKRGKSS